MEALQAGKPVVASMCIGPYADLNGVSTGECAVRMTKAGAFELCSVSFRQGSSDNFGLSCSVVVQLHNLCSSVVLHVCNPTDSRRLSGGHYVLPNPYSSCSEVGTDCYVT